MKTRTLHIAALFVALALGSQALAAASGPVMVCKFTGKVMQACPCPEPEADELPQLKRAGCCELRDVEPGDPVRGGAVAVAPLLGGEHLAVAPEGTLGAAAPQAATGVPSRASPPRPSTRLYVQHRQLLI